jgi:Glycosyl hydrolases family 8
MKSTLRRSFHPDRQAAPIAKNLLKGGKRARWRANRLPGGCRISPFCLSLALLVIAVPSHAQTPCSARAAASKYYPLYCAYYPPAGPTFWRKDVVAMTSKDGSVSKEVDHGFAIWNTSGTYGAGVVSETMGYAMILAALYNDQATFDRLSATVQAGITIGSTGLFPWYWNEKTNNCMSNCTYFSADPNSNSASDADINIALAYVYADNATGPRVYGWKNPSAMTYKMMASKYIQAIRQYDFSKTDSDLANNYVLADGFIQARSLFLDNNWHPDYSDIRAYQLFQAYEDRPRIAFWQMAINITISCWKAIFKFGSVDRRMQSAATGEINPSKFYVLLSNPTYQNLEANSVYSQIKAMRGGEDDQYYTADSQRLPIRLLNYINAKINSSANDVIEIACANLTALGTSFQNTQYKYLADKIKITDLTQNGNYIQNRTAAGLLAYGSNPMLMSKLPCGPSQTAYNQINRDFGTNGTNGTVGLQLDSGDGFNISLTLWALTVSNDGVTPLQTHILSLPE